MKVLIVDDELELAELVEFLVLDYFSDDPSIILAQSGNAAIAILEQNPDIDLCICDHNMPNGLGAHVLKYIIEKKMVTKFVLCSTITPLDRPLDYRAEHVYFNIQKPDIGKGIEALFQFMEKNWKRSKVLVQDFSPVSVHILSLMEKTPADIYLKMSDNKFVKCINKADEFLDVDREKYIAKKIETLFIKRDDQKETITQIILKTTQKIMERRSLPLADKMSIAHSQLMRQIKKTGMTPELAEASKNIIQQSVQLIMKSPVINEFWKEMNLLGEFPSKLYTLHSMLACGALKKLNMDSESSMFQLILSAYLQDLTLDSIPLMEIYDYQDFLEKRSLFNAEEVKKFHDHPAKAAEIVSQFKDLPPDILRIIMEQHEMPDGNGFPLKLKVNQLAPVSCLFIITGIFARHVLKEGDDFDFKAFIAFLEKRGYSRGNFKDGLEAIKSMQNKIVF